MLTPDRNSPRNDDVLSLSQEMSGDFPVIEGYVEQQRRTLEYHSSKDFSDDIVIASLFMQTGANYLKSIATDALDSGKSSNFYPGGIKSEAAGRGFKEAGENEKRIIMTNYAALMYGLAVQMIDEMIQSRQGIFPVEAFCSRYNVLVHGTSFPNLELNHFPKQVLEKIHTTDYGMGEVISFQDMQILIKAHKEFGNLFLFDENSQHNKLPKALLWFFKKQGVNSYFPIIHQEVRKHLNTFQTGRREKRQEMLEQMRHNYRSEQLLSQIENLDLDLSKSPNPDPETSEE